MDLTSSTDHDLEDMSANLRAKLIDEDRVFIVHISDIGKMDGYKNHLLQQLIRLPRGTYKQLVVDLSCTDPANSTSASTFYSGVLMLYLNACKFQARLPKEVGVH